MFIFENPTGSAYCDDQYFLLYLSYNGLINNKIEEGIEVMKKSMDYCYGKKVLGVISDLRAIHGNFSKALEFVEYQYIPRLIKYGMKWVVHIAPRDLLVQHLTEKIHEMNQSIEFKLFETFDVADQWIKEKDRKYK
ncbi:MAG TPA: hypothetical protein DDY13_09440 [Cytophagales bacterium]|nr:hypothetical protein [Cytophagales bacterium]